MMNQYGLVFCPKSVGFCPDNPELLVRQLQEDGLIGKNFQANQHEGYLIGQDFLKLITFLGCSPNIEVEPPEQLSDWGNFCHIDIQIFDEPQFFKGLNKPKCSCPHCRSRVTQALPDMTSWTPEAELLTCPKCGEQTLTEHLNWRNGAGFGRFFIVVNSVYPNEAVPTDKLMSILKSASNEIWNYFYFEKN